MSYQGVVTTPSASYVPIEVNVPPETGIQISNPTLHATETTFDNASFTIKNLNNKDLIAYTVAMNLFFEGNADRPMQIRVSEDGWFLNQYVLKVGESKQGLIRNSLKSQNAIKLVRVTVVPEYVEFADGEVTGTDASAVGDALKKSRDIKAELQKSYAARLSAGQDVNSVATALIDGLKNAGPKAESAYRMGLSQLNAFLNYYGADALAQKLMAPTSPRAH